MLTGTTVAGIRGVVNPELLRAVETWAPATGSRPAVAVEVRPDGVRVSLTYLGVESGVLFPRVGAVSPSHVKERLDRLFEVLSWRVTRPPEAAGA